MQCARCFVRQALSERAGQQVCKSCSFQLDQATAFYEYHGWKVVSPEGEIEAEGKTERPKVVEASRVREGPAEAPPTNDKAPKAK